MDNSLSSSSFADAADEPAELFSTKEHTVYESLIATTKEAFSVYENEIQKTTFPTYLSTVLQDSWTCIICSLEDLIKGLLSNTKTAVPPITKIIDYLNGSVYLLQMLSNVYKRLLNSVSMSCCTMKTLPKQTGLIILSVFVHCRDSESLYGHHLRSVEKQLKDLFRICHDLQLTYLLILEKYFKFDLTEQDDKTVLIESLKVNLDIGKVVQSLDVKTMAEQWKAFTAICEKYSPYIGDTNIFTDCSQVLCTLVKNNIETALEKDQDEKIVMRSLKVASFTIKILLKICNIFKQAENKNYCHILELLQYIKVTDSNHAQCHEMSAEDSLVTLMNNVVVPSDILLKELLFDDEFVNCLVNSISSLNCNEEKISDDKVLGLLLTTTSAMKCATQVNRRHNSLKTKLVTCIYTFLPYSYIHFRHIFSEPNQIRPHSILEHTLAHTTALALTMTNEEFNALERNMIETILGTKCVSALFSSNLWLLLARYVSPQLLFNQIIWLCTMYKILDARGEFSRTPQKTHLSHTLSRLFKFLDDEDKLKFCKQFRIHDDDNMSLWTALRIRNLPVDSQTNAEEAIAAKLRAIFGQLHESDSPDFLIQITSLAATCSFKTARGIDDHVVRAWSKACQEKRTIVHGLDSSTVWFYDYVQALVALTDSMVARLVERSASFVKVLHVISGLARRGDAEMKLLLTDILCKLATYQFNEHRNLIDSHLTEAFTALLQDTDEIVPMNLLRTLRSYKQNKLDSTITNIVRENSLQETWQNLNESYATKGFEVRYSKYTHKCLDSKTDLTGVHELKEVNIDDFYSDSNGSEMVVETDSDEPCNKRGKPNTHETDSVIRSLEENVSLLISQTFYTSEQLIRIQNVCEKLKNIKHK